MFNGYKSEQITLLFNSNKDFDNSYILSRCEC